MSVIKGAQVVEKMGEDITKQVEGLKSAGIEPLLAILKVGDDKSQGAYETGARKRLEKYGIKCETTALDLDVSQEDFEKAFKALNDDEKVHGILILQPLPKGLSIENVKKEINPLKDVDAISPVNLYKVMAGEKDGYAPCTAEGVIEILDYMGTEYRGKKMCRCRLFTGCRQTFGTASSCQRRHGNILPRIYKGRAQGNKGRRYTCCGGRCAQTHRCRKRQ